MEELEDLLIDPLKWKYELSHQLWVKYNDEGIIINWIEMNWYDACELKKIMLELVIQVQRVAKSQQLKAQCYKCDLMDNDVSVVKLNYESDLIKVNSGIKKVIVRELKKIPDCKDYLISLIPRYLSKGDWVCNSCYNINYNYRCKCKTCNGSCQSTCLVLK